MSDVFRMNVAPDSDAEGTPVQPSAASATQARPASGRALSMPFITNRTLARRTFLRGLGTTLALPFLESMLPARGAHAAAQKMLPTRFVGAFVPHGAAPGYWIPEKQHAGLQVPVHLRAAAAVPQERDADERHCGRSRPRIRPA